MIKEFTPEPTPVDNEPIFSTTVTADGKRKELHIHIPQLPKFTKLGFKSVIPSLVEAIAGIGITWFGVYNAGSYYMTATRFGGGLADMFYTNQLGTILIIVGLILCYDGVKRTGYV